MRLSEVMAIAIIFHGSGYKTFKEFYTLNLIVNDKGELLAFKPKSDNVDDRQPVPEMAQGLFGQLFGDRGYISQKLFEQLYA